MGSAGNPNPLAPYGSGNYKDCSAGICSVYCPQWCYIIFPPPPPGAGPFSTDSSDLSSSRPLLIIAVIGVLASLLLMMTIVYIVITKCCSGGSGTRDSNDQVLLDDQVNHEMAVTSGLDEAIIKSITVCKYKKGDSKDCCSVCLSEFEEDESLRLLPKCNHAFHLPCIDTWLISHSNCPLCRSDIIITTTTATTTTTSTTSTTSSDNVNLAALDYHYRNDTIVVVQDLVVPSMSFEQSISCYQ